MNKIRLANLKPIYTLVGFSFLFVLTIVYLLIPKGAQTFISLVSVSPQPPIMKSPWSTEPVTFTFDKPVNIETVVVSVSPQVSTKITQPNRLNEIVVVPLDGWSEGVEYTITINDSLRSHAGDILAEEVEVTFTRQADFSNYPVEHGEEYNF